MEVSLARLFTDKTPPTLVSSGISKDAIEPAAALDPVAEAEIYAKFNEISGDRTSIYISHRLSSCKFCDEIVVFHQGQIVEKGTHEELLAQMNGKYAQLWQAQAQYYTEE